MPIIQSAQEMREGYSRTQLRLLEEDSFSLFEELRTKVLKGSQTEEMSETFNVYRPSVPDEFASQIL